MTAMNSDVAALYAALELNPVCHTTLAALVDACREAGQPVEVPADSLAALAGRSVEQLDAELKAANGRRRSRTLGIHDVQQAILNAYLNPGQWQAVGGGTVANSYKYPADQVAFGAVRRSNGTVRIAFAVANAKKGASLTVPLFGLYANAKPEQFQAWADAA